MFETESYLDFLNNVKHKSNNTIDSYRRDIVAFSAFLHEQGFNAFALASERDVRSYVMSLQSNGKATSTLARVLASLRSLYAYLYSTGSIAINPTSNVEIPRVQHQKTQTLSNNEVALLLDAPNTADNKGCRDKAMLELLYSTGLKVSEMIALNIDSVDLNNKSIICRSAKNSRSLPMSERAAQSLAAYLTYARPYMVKDQNSKCLFVNIRGERMTRQGFWKIIKGYQVSLNIKTDITPEVLRQSFAKQKIGEGTDIHSMQKLMGHTVVASTRLYMNNRVV